MDGVQARALVECVVVAHLKAHEDNVAQNLAGKPILIIVVYVVFARYALSDEYQRQYYQPMLGVITLSPTLTSCTSKTKKTPQEIILGAEGGKPQHYAMSWLDNKNTLKDIKQVNSTLSGFRGHGVAQHPLHPASAIMVARRPGTVALEINFSGHALACLALCYSFSHK